MSSLLNPFFLSDRALRKKIARLGADMRGIVLDVGCGARPYEAYFSNADYVGLEVRQGSEYGSAKRPDILFDGIKLPIRETVANNVLCTQVLEHVFEPSIFLSEINRVLVPGGSLLITAPFIWDEHEQPYDFARYSSFGLLHMASRHGFRVDVAERTLADSSIFVQLWLAYIFKVVRDWPPPVRKLFMAGLSLPLNCLGLVMAISLPSSPDLYLDNVMLWTKVSTSPSGQSLQ